VRPIQHVEWVLAVILDQVVTTKRVYGNSGSLGAHDRDMLLGSLGTKGRATQQVWEEGGLDENHVYLLVDSMRLKLQSYSGPITTHQSSTFSNPWFSHTSSFLLTTACRHHTRHGPRRHWLALRGPRPHTTCWFSRVVATDAAAIATATSQCHRAPHGRRSAHPSLQCSWSTIDVLLHLHTLAAMDTIRVGHPVLALPSCGPPLPPP
jgi:hypothetical protein